MGNKLCSCLKASAEEDTEGFKSGNRRRNSKKLKGWVFGDKRDATVDIEHSSTKEDDTVNVQENNLINVRRASLFSVATDSTGPAVFPIVRVSSSEQSTGMAHKTAATDDIVSSSEQSTCTAHKSTATDDRVSSSEQRTGMAHKTAATCDVVMPACSEVMPDSTDKDRSTATSALNGSTRNTTDGPVFFEPSTKTFDRNVASAPKADTSTLENDDATASEHTEEHRKNADEQITTTDQILPAPTSTELQNALIPSCKGVTVATPVFEQTTADSKPTQNAFEMDNTHPDHNATSTSMSVLQNDTEIVTSQKKSDARDTYINGTIAVLEKIVSVPVSAIQAPGKNKAATVTTSSHSQSTVLFSPVETLRQNTKASENDIATALERSKGPELNITNVITPAESIKTVRDYTRQSPTSSTTVTEKKSATSSASSCYGMTTTTSAQAKISTDTTSEARELPALKNTATEAKQTPYTSDPTCITKLPNTLTESEITTSFKDVKVERKVTIVADPCKAKTINEKNTLETDNITKSILTSPSSTNETASSNITQTTNVVCKSKPQCNTQVSSSSKQKLVSDIRSLSSRPSPKVSSDEALEPFRRLAKMLAAAKSSSDLASRTGLTDGNDSSKSVKQQYPRPTSSLTATTTTTTAYTTVKTATSDQVISNVQLPSSSNDASSKDIKKSQSLPVVERKSKNVSDFAVPKGGKAPPMKPLKIKPKPKHLYALPTIAGTDIEDESQRNWTQHDSTSEKAKMPWMSQRPQFDVAFPKPGKTLLQRLGSVDKIIACRTVPLPKRIELLKVEFGRFPGLKIRPKDASKYPSIFNLTPSQTSLNEDEMYSEADDDGEEN